jgi:ribose 5-phosphate isomerase A
VKAIDYVEDGMIVGVGTGSTVAYFIDALAGMPRPHRRRRLQFRAEHRACSRRGIEVLELNETGDRSRCTWTAPTNATRTSA